MSKTFGNILLVEDDKNLGLIIKDFLELANYNVVLKDNGQEGLNEFRRAPYDLILLDVMLPLKDGFTVAEEIRASDCEIPIIFMTAKTLKEDRIKGFRTGADDYITKPFSTEELKLRIRAVLRRTRFRINPVNKTASFKIGNYLFDYSNHQLIFPNGDRRTLTRRESELLNLLCLHMNNVLRRDVALKAIWGEDDYFMGRSMDVYITKLRKLLSNQPGISIVNIHNTGFKLEVNEANLMT